MRDNAADSQKEIFEKTFKHFDRLDMDKRAIFLVEAVSSMIQEGLVSVFSIFGNDPNAEKNQEAKNKVKKSKSANGKSKAKRKSKKS